MTEQIPVDSMTWYCTTCGETVTHQHSPMKPSYEELLTTLRVVQEAGQGTPFENYMNGCPYARVVEMLDRAEHGR